MERQGNLAPVIFPHSRHELLILLVIILMYSVQF